MYDIRYKKSGTLSQHSCVLDQVSVGQNVNNKQLPGPVWLLDQRSSQQPRLLETATSLCFKQNAALQICCECVCVCGIVFVYPKIRPSVVETFFPRFIAHLCTYTGDHKPNAVLKEKNVLNLSGQHLVNRSSSE